jgi:IBR domain, a half RING-finger domain/CCCH-type zinc finger/Zinc finger C-x8-C-x5-C-x3-H type (and similar)
MPTCRYYVQGQCLRGNSCFYSHDLAHHVGQREEAGKSSADRPSALTVTSPNFIPRVPLTFPLSDPSSTDTRSAIPCRFFQRGRCRNGTSCSFAHTVGEDVPGLAGLNINDGTTPSQADQNDRAKAYKREFGGSLVEFGDGAQVQNLSLPADFSAVRINGLQLDWTAIDCVNVLAGFGFEVSETCVRMTRGQDGGNASADVRVEDPLFAIKLCERLAREKHGNSHAAHLQAAKVPVKLAFDSSAQTVDCRTVTCSWHKPTRIAWMNFGSGDIAKRVADEFNSGSYNVLSKKVTCDTPTRGEGHHNTQAWTVVMEDLPGYADGGDITFAIRYGGDKPRHIELGKPSYGLRHNEAGEAVRRMLDRIGSVESFELKDATDSKRLKATVRFSQDSDAIEAVRVLNEASLPFSKSKLLVQAVCSTKLKVASHIYDAVAEELKREVTQWQKQHIHLSVYPPSEPGQRYTAMKLSGQDVKQIALAKDSLLKILDGFTIKENNAPVWSKSFNDAATLQRFKQLEQVHGVVIVRDRRKARVRLYGSFMSRALAEKAVIKMAASAVTTTHTIELTPDQFRHMVQSGYHKAINVLGEDAVIIDIVSTPKRLFVTGSARDYQAVQRILNSPDSGNEHEAEEEGTCAICWTEAESPLVTKCHHTYCLDCFENLCAAPAHGAEEYSICCAGNGGKCQTIFNLDELQDSLSSTAFEDILQSSFTSYIRRRPQSFRYCPQPDCGYIYRVADPSRTSIRTTHRCTKCFTAICTMCHAAHDNMTCADFKDLQSGGHAATEKLKKQLGFKDCPKCGTTMEKTEGCNHMVCSGCKTHICWVCMATFSSSDPCYKHMNKVHGGIGLNDLLFLGD